MHLLNVACLKWSCIVSLSGSCGIDMNMIDVDAVATICIEGELCLSADSAESRFNLFVFLEISVVHRASLIELYQLGEVICSYMAILVSFSF